uniref:DNA repair protein recA homolog 2, mitochondrial n=1 Tax=Ananas comosus var. bracteatus TaxID=296719 RepID=A0A6V7PBX1_ANACO|nr:unnamed protein product [Ananas comosus var. bracteatus]
MRCLKPFSIYSAILRAIRLPASVRNARSPPPFPIPAVETLLEYERDEPLDDGKVVKKESTLNLALCRLAVQGRIVEIFGKEASGKTTLALHIVKEAQKIGGCCAYFDVENALNPSFAESIGINTGNLLIARPDSAENSLSIVNTLVNSGSVDVIVVDSVAALVPKCELDGIIDLNSEDVRANLRSNQSVGEKNEVACGGNALKFYAAIRMRISRKGLLQTEDKITGVGISVQIVKNKLAPSMKKATLDIQFGKGICHEAEILEMASLHGIILREGGGYWIKGSFFKDQAEAEHFLSENSTVADELVNNLRSQLFEMPEYGA